MKFWTSYFKRNIVNWFSYETQVISSNFRHEYNIRGDIFLNIGKTWKIVRQQLIKIPLPIHFRPHLILTIPNSIEVSCILYDNFLWFTTIIYYLCVNRACFIIAQNSVTRPFKSYRVITKKSHLHFAKASPNSFVILSLCIEMITYSPYIFCRTLWHRFCTWCISVNW